MPETINWDDFEAAPSDEDFEAGPSVIPFNAPEPPYDREEAMDRYLRSRIGQGVDVLTGGQISPEMRESVVGMVRHPIRTAISGLAQGAELAGSQLRGLAGATAFNVIGEPELAQQQLEATAKRVSRTPLVAEMFPELREEIEKSRRETYEEPTPLEEGMRALPKPARLAAEAGYGTVEFAPKLAAIGGLQAAGV